MEAWGVKPNEYVTSTVPAAPAALALSRTGGIKRDPRAAAQPATLAEALSMTQGSAAQVKQTSTESPYGTRKTTKEPNQYMTFAEVAALKQRQEQKTAPIIPPQKIDLSTLYAAPQKPPAPPALPPKKGAQTAPALPPALPPPRGPRVILNTSIS